MSAIPPHPTGPGVPAAGWYPDPSAPGMLRWFDGTRWTQATFDARHSGHYDGGAYGGGAHPYATASPASWQDDPARQGPAGSARKNRSPFVAPAMFVLGGIIGVIVGALVATGGSGDDTGGSTSAVVHGAAPHPSPSPSDDGWATSGPDGTSTCGDLRHEALANPKYYWKPTTDGPKTLTNASKIFDHQETADDPKAGETIILLCRFDATYRDGTKAPLFGVIDLEPDDSIYLSFTDVSPDRTT